MREGRMGAGKRNRFSRSHAKRRHSIETLERRVLLTVFVDDFNRPDSNTVGNGWLDTAGNNGGNLVIRNNEVTAPAPDGTAGIYRPFSFTSPVTISATLKEENGFGGLLRRYTSNLSIDNDGTVLHGYGLNFSRGDQNYPSAIYLFDAGTTIASVTPSFEFGPEINTTFTISPDGSVVGSVSQGTDVYNFSFGPHAIQSTGSNFSYATGFADPRSGTITNPRLDDLRLVTSAPGLTKIEGDAPRDSDGQTTHVVIERLDHKIIDPDAPTWIVIHGRTSSASESNIQRLAKAIDGYQDGDQVMTLDWHFGAAAPGGTFDNKGEGWIQPVAKWAATELAAYGFAGKSLNLVGHSWGSYVAAELAERIPLDSGGSTDSVNTIVGLDPAADARPSIGGTDYDPNADVNFADHSNFSWAFHSSILGSSVTPATADESYNVMLVDPLSTNLAVDAHSGAVDVFSKIVECNDPEPRVTGASPNNVSRLFTLDRLLSGRAIFGPQAGFEADIQGTKIATEGDDVARWEALSLRPIPRPITPPTYYSVKPDTGSDLQNSPTSISLSTTPINNWVGAASMDDFFAFSITKNTDVTIRLDGLAADASLTLLKNGNPWKQSDQLGNASEVISRKLGKGHYIVHVRAGSIYDNTYYRLSVSTTASAAAGTASAPVSDAVFADSVFTDTLSDKSAWDDLEGLAS